MKWFFILSIFFIAGCGSCGDVEVKEAPVPVNTTTPADTADKGVITPGGKAIRVVGVDYKKDANVIDIEIGNAVVVDEVKPTSMCNMIFEAKRTTMKLLYEDDEKSNRAVPDIPAFKGIMGKASWPIIIDGSCNANTCLWNSLFRGTDCLTVADHPSYRLSSIQEALPLEDEIPDWKCRLIKTIVNSQMVSVCDPSADRDGELFIPHGWAGRKQDLNYKKVDLGETKPRGE
jgi:hypothetical protein